MSLCVSCRGTGKIMWVRGDAVVGSPEAEPAFSKCESCDGSGESLRVVDPVIPKAVSISSLSMRFYKNDGWTLPILKEFIIGDIVQMDQGTDRAYWIPGAHARVLCRQLHDSGHLGQLRGRDSWSELKGMTDLEVLEDRS